ncbi:MAG TPA: tellurite resistance TerB family protein [Reyranella sp.]|nr:tellurite resistance TerB family protein [Reyranella sp.]
MFDAKRLLDQFLGGQDGQGGKGGKGGAGEFMKGAGGGALAGGLAAILLGSKTGREIGGEALKLGGMAAVGALAYKAYRDWQAGKEEPAAPPAQQSVPMLPAPSGTPFNPSTESGQQKLARHLLRAMIAAAKADGNIDAQEQTRIFAEMDKLPLAADDKAFVMDELRAKLDIDAVAGAAETPEEAAEIYTASLLAIDVDNAAERGYLAMLAARLKLDDALVAHLQQTVAAAAGKVAQPPG